MDWQFIVYLEYLHRRLSLSNNSASVIEKECLFSFRSGGGSASIA